MQFIVKEIMEFLNSRHANIKFTCEIEEKMMIPFLDVLIIRDEIMGFLTKMYRKKTFTGTYLNWNSMNDR